MTLTYTEYRRTYGNSIIYACGDYVSQAYTLVCLQRSVKQESHGFNRVECQIDFQDMAPNTCADVGILEESFSRLFAVLIDLFEF